MSSIVLQVADRLVDLQDVSGSPGVGNAPVWDGSSFVLTTLRSAAFLQAGVASGVAQLDSGGKVPAAQLPQAIVDGLHFAGLWNASTNTPTLQSGMGTKGAIYKVSVSGGTVIDGIGDWEAGDSLYFDGTTWDSIDGLASEVLSVAGRVGNVVLTTADITDFPTLATVAESGQYADLLGLPSIFSGDFRDLSNPPAFMPVGGIWHAAPPTIPGQGQLVDSAGGGPWGGISTLAVNAIDAYGIDRTTQLNLIQVGDYLEIWFTAADYGFFHVTNISISSGSYYFSVNVVAGNGNTDNTFSKPYYFGLAYHPTPTLATVATTGAYSDLSGLPDLSVYALSSSLASYALLTNLPSTGLQYHQVGGGSAPNFGEFSVFNGGPSASAVLAIAFNQLDQNSVDQGSFWAATVGNLITLLDNTGNGWNTYLVTAISMSGNQRDLTVVYVGGDGGSLGSVVNVILGGALGGKGPGNASILTDWHVVAHSATPTIDWNDGPFQQITMEENETISFANVPAVARPLCLRLIQGGAGSFTAGFTGGMTIRGTTTAQLTAVGSEDIWVIQRLATDTYSVGTANQYA